MLIRNFVKSIFLSAVIFINVNKSIAAALIPNGLELIVLFNQAHCHYTEFLLKFYRLSPEPIEQFNDLESFIDNEELFIACYTEYLKRLNASSTHGTLKKDKISFSDVEILPIVYRYLVKKVAYNEFFKAFINFVASTSEGYMVKNNAAPTDEKLISNPFQVDCYAIFAFAEKYIKNLQDSPMGITELLTDFQHFMLFSDQQLNINQLNELVLQEEFFSTISLSHETSLAQFFSQMPQMRFVFPKMSEGVLEANFNFSQKKSRLQEERQVHFLSLLSEIHVYGYAPGIAGYFNFTPPLLDIFNDQMKTALGGFKGEVGDFIIESNDKKFKTSLANWRLLQGQKYFGEKLSFSKVFASVVNDFKKPFRLKFFLEFSSQIPEVLKIYDEETKMTLQEAIFTHFLLDNTKRGKRSYLMELIAANEAYGKLHMQFISELDIKLNNANEPSNELKELANGWKDEPKVTKEGKSSSGKKKKGKNKKSRDKKENSKDKSEKNVAKNLTKQKTSPAAPAPSMSQKKKPTLKNSHGKVPKAPKVASKKTKKKNTSTPTAIVKQADVPSLPKVEKMPKKVTEFFKAAKKVMFEGSKTSSASTFYSSMPKRTIGIFNEGGIGHEIVLKNILAAQQRLYAQLQINTDMMLLHNKMHNDMRIIGFTINEKMNEFKELCKKHAEIQYVLAKVFNFTNTDQEAGEVIQAIENIASMKEFLLYSNFARLAFDFDHLQTKSSYDALGALLWDSAEKLSPSKINSICNSQINDHNRILFQKGLFFDLAALNARLKNLLENTSKVQTSLDRLMNIYKEFSAQHD